MTARLNSDLAWGADTAPNDDTMDIDWMRSAESRRQSIGRITVQPNLFPAETITRSSIRIKANYTGIGVDIMTASDRLTMMIGASIENCNEAKKR